MDRATQAFLFATVWTAPIVGNPIINLIATVIWCALGFVAMYKGRD